MRVRPARLSDIDSLYAIETRSFRTDILSIARLRLYARQKNARMLVADKEGKVAGYILVLLHRGHRQGRVYSLAVAPEWRGLGVGHALLHAAERQTAKAGFARVTLEVRKKDSATIRFYKNAGYVPVAALENYYQDGQAALRMRKSL